MIAPGFARAHRRRCRRSRSRTPPDSRPRPGVRRRMPRRLTLALRRHTVRLPRARRLRRRRHPVSATGRSAPPVTASRQYPPGYGDAVDQHYAVAQSCSASGARRFATRLPCRARFPSRPFGRESFAPPLASLAARPLPGGSLRSPPFASPPPRRAAPALRCFRLRLILAPALRIREAAWLARRVPPAQSPPRLPSGSDSGTVPPDVRYPGSGLLYALRRLGSHTPRSALPKTTPPTFHYAPATFDLPSSTPEYDTGRHEYVGQSVYGFHIRFISLICMKKRDPAFHRESL